MDEAYDRAIQLYNKPDISTEELKRVLQDYQGMMNAEANRYVFESGGRMSQKQMDALGVYQGTIKALREIIATREADNKVVNNSIGLIPQLEAKIQSLNEALNAATSESQIAKINADLAKTNEELKRLKELQPERTIQKVAGISIGNADVSGLTSQLEAKIKSLNEALNTATSGTRIAEINADLAKTNEELKRLKELQSGGVDLSGLTAAPTVKKGVLLDNTFGKMQAEGYIAEATKKAEEIAEVNSNIKGILSNSFADLATTFGEGIGNAITGGDFNPLNSLLEAFGSLLKQLGSALIAYGTALKGFKEALKSLNPWVAIAAGVAAVAAGTVVKKIARGPIKLATGGLAYGPTLAVVGDNPGATSDPEVVAPLSKLRNYMGGQKLELVGSIDWVLEGDSLRAVLNRENIRLSTLR